MDRVDRAWAAAKVGGGDFDNVRDFKLPLSRGELGALVGRAAVARLADLMDGVYSDIVVRRCEEHGKLINFHTDVSLKTLQVPLNGEHEYDGGRLTFVTPEGLVAPRRPAGSATVHDHRIAHGVTKLTDGVRYGLFFLRKK